MLAKQTRTLAECDSPIASSSKLPASLVLEITHGKTCHPERPVRQPRFLVGSGDACDLRLGGDDMPALHSVILIERDGIALESIAAFPLLLVNGRRVRSADLQNGDVIRIGGIELRARITPQGNTAIAEPIPSLDLDELEVDPASLSALELIELIERDTALVDEFESHQRLGATALLSAARHQQLPRPAANQAALSREISERSAPLASPAGFSLRADLPHLERDFLPHFDQLGEALTELSRKLHLRGKGTASSSDLKSAAALLLDAQRALSAEIDLLLSKVESIPEETSVSRRRAIA